MKKKHTFAIIFMAVAIAGSIPLGINRSLSRIREDAASDYYYDQAGYAIFEGIEERRAAANDLITLAGRYSEQDPVVASLADHLDYWVRTSENAWSDDNTFTAEAQANANLDAPAQALAAKLEEVGLSDKDQKYPKQIIDRMKSEQDKIKRSSYNDQARSYNAKLKRLRPFAVLKPMATFDSEGGAEQAEVTEVVEDTGIPSPPDAPRAPEAPSVDDATEWAEDYADRVADRAEAYAENAEDLADSIAEGAEDLADTIADSVEDFIDGIFG